MVDIVKVDLMQSPPAAWRSIPVKNLNDGSRSHPSKSLTGIYTPFLLIRAHKIWFNMNGTVLLTDGFSFYMAI